MGFLKDLLENNSVNRANYLFFVLGGLDFEALLIKPKEVKDGVKLPLIVTPHGQLLLSLFFSIQTI